MTYLKPKQVADKLQVSMATVYRLLRKGHFGSCAEKVGGLWRIKEKYFDQ